MSAAIVCCATQTAAAQLSFSPVSTVLSHARSGRMRLLGASSTTNGEEWRRSWTFGSDAGDRFFGFVS
jgi:hypothetical protein